ncbi:MAG: glutathione peroxidase [Acidobacteriota bacterium]
MNYAEVTEEVSSIYDFTMNDIDGNPVKLDKYRGKVVMIINVASKCGLTKQYIGLQEIYKNYMNNGFVILGFPANNFLRQEPGSDSEIKEFCSLNFGVKFPMFSKISVKGKKIHPLYKFLTGKETNPGFSGKIRWNFDKFLFNKKGKPIARFHPKIKPLDTKITEIIEAELAK